jgi:hypothetical protein
VLAACEARYDCQSLSILPSDNRKCRSTRYDLERRIVRMSLSKYAVIVKGRIGSFALTVEMPLAR